jgi:IS1 family transposase
MYVLQREKQVTALAALSEGASIRSVERLTGSHRDTITRLMVRAGVAAQAFMDRSMRNLSCRSIQLDEQWTFVAKKQRWVKAWEDRSRMGDFWIWSAIDADSRAVPSFRLGKRDGANANAFLRDVASRLKNRVQVSADGLHLYVEAVEQGFGGECDFGSIVKSYEAEPIGAGRYSPPRVKSVDRSAIVGNPNPKLISTSYVERLHLLNRMRCRRLTRLVDAFSRKVENLEAAVGLHYFVYNYVRRHGAHKLTPAQAIGVERDPLSLNDLLDMSHAE